MGANRRFAPAALIRTAVIGTALLTAGAVAAEERVGLDEVARVQGLSPVDGTDFDRVYIRPGTSLAQIGQVALAPIELSIDYDRDDVILKEPQKRHARRFFAEELEEEFGGRLTSEATQGATRLEITLTDFLPNRSYFGQTERGRWVDQSISIGGASFTARLVDAQTNEVIALIEDEETGLPLGMNPSIHTMYGTAEKAMREWAKDLAALIGSGPAQG